MNRCLEIRPLKSKSEEGFVVLLCCFLITVIITFTAFSVDIGNTNYEKRKMQIAADAAALAALNVLGSSTNYSTVLAQVQTYANANGVTNAEVTAVHPRCGTWAANTFTPQTIDTCNGSTNAVKVTVSRTVPTLFARVINVNSLSPIVESISYLPAATNNCFRPFGVENSFLTSNNVQANQTFTINGTQASGNWGKLDIGGNLSSGQAFQQAMLSNICDASVQVGNVLSPGTGNAQINNVFQTILNDTSPPLASQEMVLAATTDFPNGNSGTVTIQRFIKVNLLSQSGNGSNWSASFYAVDMNANPDPGGNGGGSGTGSRALVQ